MTEKYQVGDLVTDPDGIILEVLDVGGWNVWPQRPDQWSKNFFKAEFNGLDYLVVGFPVLPGEPSYGHLVVGMTTALPNPAVMALELESRMIAYVVDPTTMTLVTRKAKEFKAEPTEATVSPTAVDRTMKWAVTNPKPEEPKEFGAKITVLCWGEVVTAMRVYPPGAMRAWAVMAPGDPWDILWSTWDELEIVRMAP